MRFLSFVMLYRVEHAKEKELLHRNQYKTVKEALVLFQNDELESNPGSKYGYTTHGFTLLSAVLEGAADGKAFEKQIKELTKELGMHDTQLDLNLPLIANRSRYYYRKPNSVLVNVPEVDNSYKWAGGGLLSTVSDLLVFGNAVLYSYQSDPSAVPKPLLKSTTVRHFWTPALDKERGYGLGWVAEPRSEINGPKSRPWNRTNFFYHTGGAVGATSILLIKPNDGKEADGHPSGVCVSILINIQNASHGLLPLAQNIAQAFDASP
uniref:Beta-lactamase-related domain-containing protein n=1 Tax=Plectus sambesii TaxID=2011161 RepID=A0A914VYR3_9BILA